MSAHMRGGCRQSTTGNRNEKRRVRRGRKSSLKGVPVCLKQVRLGECEGGIVEGKRGEGVGGVLCHVTHLIYRLNGLPAAPAVDGL